MAFVNIVIVNTGMDNNTQAAKHSYYVATHAGILSLAIPPLVVSAQLVKKQNWM